MKRSRPPVNSQQSTLPSMFRIIGGIWRSRKFHFPDTPGLRPTPDRVRETLFNWLQNDIAEATCLDLFCGSGALGLEALSRGAAHCTFMDGEPRVLAAITQHLQTLQCAEAKCITASLPTAIAQLNKPFDLVFLDPPYALDCINVCIDSLISKHLLNDGAIIYIECSSKKPLPTIPENLTLHRHKSAGQVQYALLQYNANPSLCD